MAEFEELVSKAAPPDDSLKAIEYIRAVPSLRSAYDAARTESLTAPSRSMKKKLPEKEKELKEAIRRELNPTETPPEQKRKP